MMSIRHIFVSIALLIGACLIVGSAAAQEAEGIRNYDVTLDIKDSADIIVTERLQVYAAGRSIRRGIFRDLPRYKLDQGEPIPYQYKILSVTRNGAREPYEKSAEGNARRVRVGDADVYLPTGLHTYEIVYRVKNEIRYGEDADELYWNVTGNYWKFPIDQATATIALPEGARPLEVNAYTGRMNAKGRDARTVQSGRTVNVKTTQSLDTYEGLTVSVRFTPGIVAPLTEVERGIIWWFKNGALVLLSISLLGLVQYYSWSWLKVGRDPAKLPVFARYGPPEGYSPAALIMIRGKGLSGMDAISATLVNMAIKGMIRLDADKKTITLTRLEAKPQGQTIFIEEADLYNNLFGGWRDKLRLDGDYHATFTKAQTKFATDISTRYGKSYFKWNVAYIISGIVLSLVAIAIAMSQLYSAVKPAFAISIALLVALNIVFIYLLPARTPKGAQRISDIEGFRLYLKLAESNKLNAVTVGLDAPPPMTKALYERFLPYAMALGVEKPWSKAFERALPREADDYDASWGHVDMGRLSGASGFSKSLSSNLSSGVSSAMPQSSSSSGGGAGGFSGGGGGGGGGGGW